MKSHSLDNIPVSMKEDKKSPDILEFKTKKSEWTVENAMYVLSHPTVDSKTWAEAVEWLLLYGPPEIQESINNAAGNATQNCFPDLKSKDFSNDGEPCFKTEDIAEALGIDTEKAKEILKQKEEAHGRRFFLDEEETSKTN